MESKGIKGFIDLHTHLLPGVDDGAQSMDQALALLRMAWENGTRALVLTPHYRGRYRQNTPQQLRHAFAQLQEAASAELPHMQLYLGQEIAYETDAPEAMYQGKLLSMHSSPYVLLEFRPNALRSQIITGISEMINCGFIPIVAHIERCAIARKERDLAEELLCMGALLQLNADSVLGANGFWVKHYCHKLLKAHMVHFVASDAHDSAQRPPLLRECFLRVHKKYGLDYAAALFCENAQAVIENRIIE